MNRDECIRLCLECAIACEVCLYKMSGLKSHNDCPVCCRECLELCLLCAQAMARESKWEKEYCRLCAEVCEWCADQCAEHTHHDHCLKCAESCRKCADACRQMAA
ncbi:MAG: four-helix bundle copper-binding protein [Methylohalobius crimeensis]